MPKIRKEDCSPDAWGKTPMEPSKYYTPLAEEFCVGFEYEILQKSEWIKDTYMCNSKVGVTFDDMPELAKLSRVKHLDREDIESLGWRITDMHNIEYDKNLMTVYETDTHIMTINNNPEKYDWFAVHSKGDLGRIIIETRIIIKNKSELKKVLKMIGI